MNFLLRTDSYKLTHWDMYPPETTHVYSYLEARLGGLYKRTKFFGLQALLKSYFEGQVFDTKDIDEAETIADFHFGRKGQFNRKMWEHILRTYGGRLPIRIMAVPEGTVVPVSNILMSVENLDEKTPSLTNAVESLLLKVWYPTTVATLSLEVKDMLRGYLEKSGSPIEALNFMLHDFGYRGVSSEESAIMGGMAHILNFMGTDTLPAMWGAQKFYGARMDQLAYSVAASEHSIMTSNGARGEIDRARRIVANHPNQIVSLVADSYDYYNFVKEMAKEQELVNRSKVRLVLRPDSTTKDHSTPEGLVLWTLQYLAEHLNGITTTPTGHKILPYGVLWGDGIGPEGIEKIVKVAIENGFAASNLVFGMGGGLLQKVNRDTCRFAFKCSAQKQDGKWVDIQKVPLDASKASKKGRLQLIHNSEGTYSTMGCGEGGSSRADILLPVFENGVILNQSTWEQVKNRS